jgi:hypothetical protein
MAGGRSPLHAGCLLELAELVQHLAERRRDELSTKQRRACKDKYATSTQGLCVGIFDNCIQ